MKKGLIAVASLLMTCIVAAVYSAPIEPVYTAYMVKPAGNSGSGAAAATISGTVTETMNSGGYTYVQIDNNGSKKWVAVPSMKVKVGDAVSFAPGMEMQNFESKSLKRTFDTIIFSTGPAGKEKAASAAPKKAKPAAAATEKVSVEKASAPNAYTVAELYEKSAELDKKEIVLRGKVVKVSPAIMGKNWIHIQDGTGSASSGNNDLLVTSQDLPAVGDIVTATGTLYKDKDFGSGYKYAVIIEEAGVKQ